jgi:hypothetical protein
VNAAASITRIAGGKYEGKWVVEVHWNERGAIAIALPLHMLDGSAMNGLRF